MGFFLNKIDSIKKKIFDILLKMITSSSASETILEVLDHLLLNIGPFARCWTSLCLSNGIGHFVSQDSLSYKTQRPLRLIRQGRCSPEATVNYITEDEMTHHLFSARDRNTVTNI
ncbi:hypothetical protein AMECASPLE_039736 [Ameca splendens]|uniref:Uncharacterized protein n=1 Tax=Ameca splendens TaxID=208324 RepID=A0ABV0XXZ3_9TELE